MDIHFHKEPKKEYIPPVLEVVGQAVKPNLKSLHLEFFDKTLHKRFTIEELRKLAKEHTLIISETKRDENDEINLTSYSINKMFDDNGKEIPMAEYSDDVNSPHRVGGITVEDNRKRNTL